MINAAVDMIIVLLNISSVMSSSLILILGLAQKAILKQVGVVCCTLNIHFRMYFHKYKRCWFNLHSLLTTFNKANNVCFFVSAAHSCSHFKTIHIFRLENFSFFLHLNLCCFEFWIFSTDSILNKLHSLESAVRWHFNKCSPFTRWNHCKPFNSRESLWGGVSIRA